MSVSRTRLANAAHAAMLQRTQLQRSLSITGTELKPKSLVGRGKYHVKSTAHQAADFALDEIHDKRVPLAIAGVLGTIWMLRQPIRDKGPSLLSSAGARAKSFAAALNRQLDPGAREADYIDDAKKAARKASAALDRAQTKAANAAHKIHEHVEDRMKPLGQTARDTRDKASELAEKAADSARQTADAAKARVQDGYGRAREVTSDLATKGREQAGAAKDAASAALVKSKEKAQVAGSRLRGYAEDQPLTLLLGALAAGLVIGSLVSRKDDAE